MPGSLWYPPICFLFCSILIGMECIQRTVKIVTSLKLFPEAVFLAPFLLQNPFNHIKTDGSPDQ